MKRTRITPARRRATRPPLPPDDERHGTIGGYTNWSCRCEPCTTANREWQRTHSARRNQAVA